MAYVSRRYRCEKCRKGFRTHREAEDCEIGHITSAAIEDLIETLDIERVYLPEVASLNRELAAMKALADRLAEFSVHRAECARKRIHFTAVSPDCTCGLTQALTEWRNQ